MHLLEPIRIKKQEWVLLAGRISLLEVDKHDTKWKDTYDIWCCSSEKVTIKDDGNARNLTIELEDYLGELKEYQENSNTPWLCKRIKNITDQSSVLEETYLVLPPSDIIKFFNLKLNISDMSWENQDKEQIIICNNNKNSYYSDPIGGTVFIRKDFLDKFTQSHTIKYFAFTERYIHETGDAEETSLHFEIMDGRIVKEIKNDGVFYDGNLVSNPLCVNCHHIDIKSDVREPQKHDMEWLNKLLKEYRGIDDYEKGVDKKRKYAKMRLPDR